MNNSIESKKSQLKKVADKVVLLAKKSNRIKPVQEAFKDVPTSKEDHKGKLNYFNK